MIKCCKNCGSEFKTYPSKKSVFCGLECFAHSQRGRQNSNARYSKELVKSVIDLRKSLKTYKEIAFDLGTTIDNVSRILTGELSDGGRTSGYETQNQLISSLQPLSDRAISIANGSLLGDGSISKPRTRGTESKLRKSQKHGRKEYLDWHQLEFDKYSKNVSTTKKCVVFSTVHHKFFSEMRREWYGTGVKKVPQNIVIDDLCLAVWYADDGSYSKSNKLIQLCTQCFSEDDVDILRDKLSDLKVKTYVNYDRSGPIIRVHADSRDRFFGLIKPHFIWECFKHKLP
jgi:hypothetical protein